MALDCDNSSIIMSGKKPTAHCNPQDDSNHRNQKTLFAVQSTVKTAPWPVEAEDLPPWSHLEQMKKEANEVAMYSFPEDENQVVFPLASDSALDTPTVSLDDIVDDEDANPIITKSHKGETEDHFLEKSSIDNGKEFTGHRESIAIRQIPSALSEYTSFAKRDNDERQGQTVENFNQFLELSSMTANSCEIEVAMGTRFSCDRKYEKDGTKVQDSQYMKDNGEGTARRGLWPERLLGTPQMTDAPSGILLVFDRMLDCIDPGGGLSETPLPTNEDYVCGYETDQSSAWSLSVSQSWLLREFGDLGTAYSGSTDDCNLFGSVITPIENKKPSSGAEWLDDSLDCIFPCWKEFKDVGETNHDQPLRSEEYEKVIDTGRKRKWDDDELMENSDIKKTEVEEEQSKIHSKGSGENQESEAITKSIHSVVSGEDPFDFPPEEFPPPVWENQELTTANKDVDNDSESSLSELFEGLVFAGTPSDESDLKNDDELQQFLDRTSETEETSTLSYSDGTI